MAELPFSVTVTVADTGADSTAIAVGKYVPSGAAMPTSVLCPADLKGTSRLKFQVSHDNSTWHDLYSNGAVLPLALTISVVLGVPNSIQQMSLGWDYLRLVTLDTSNADKTPTADISFEVFFASQEYSPNHIDDVDSAGMSLLDILADVYNASKHSLNTTAVP